MKRMTFIMLLLASNITMAQTIRVITSNIRLNVELVGINAWPTAANR